MKDRPDLVGLVCRPHCRFFRPGEKEELSCAGYDEIARRAAAETIARWTARFGGEVPPPAYAHDPRIERLICDRCEFRADGCDFMAGPPAGPVPCGGYVLLARLLAAGDREVLGWLK